MSVTWVRNGRKYTSKDITADSWSSMCKIWNKVAICHNYRKGPSSGMLISSARQNLSRRLHSDVFSRFLRILTKISKVLKADFLLENSITPKFKYCCISEFRVQWSYETWETPVQEDFEKGLKGENLVEKEVFWAHMSQKWLFSSLWNQLTTWPRRWSTKNLTLIRLDSPI